MVYTVSSLISRAYNTANVVPRDFRSVTGDQQTEGLNLLNELLAVKTANHRMIPYYKEYQFDAVPGQEKYHIPNLILLETLTFLIDDSPQTVRFPTYDQSRKEYFGSARAEGVASIIYKRHLERSLGGADIYLQFLPDTAYPITIWGKFALSQVTLNQDLSLILDLFYISYLRYSLAAWICSEYSTVMPPEASQTLEELENVILDISPKDMSVEKASMFGGSAGLTWGDVNTGRGNRPVRRIF
jgi:hypothetical protein